ncbi:ABC transporter permease [Microlunatus parietis]|uniref:ABC-type transport system involved in multi-copper enzyme maturation permease subunit n=1 Tax=Microlunatus parietis TaxID=682979 RepID=A0A7Y9LCF6_9ACTN|nr:ABC transporter permease [Microlunatus parietis]NYE72797.1 ABC-type transport system involved in multi-copper enzyme maturation permease subunit [Microlunatus parietis]
MITTIKGELTRLFSTRLPWVAAIVAVVCGGALTLVLGLIGPENATPPLPGLDTAEGVGTAVGLSGLVLFVPALIGTIAITGEYRHRTIGGTFLAAPRRGRVLGAKLVVYALFGLGYGCIAAASSGLAVLVAAAVRGVALGIGPGTLLIMLGQLTVAAAVYMVLGVAIGALARNQIVAIAVVLGYFYFLEYVLMIIPGLNAIYPVLPGGATSALINFTFLTDVITNEAGLGLPALLSPVGGALILLGYAAVSAAVAVLVPLRRDLS